MQPLRILLLSDTRPGHYRLSEGIAAAVARLWPVDVCRVETRRPRWLGEPLALATNLGVPPAVLLRRVFGVEPTSLLPADLIISAGSETLAANVALARLGHVPNIFYGSLRRFQPGDFTLALSSYRRAGMAANQLVALKPSALDPDVAVPLAWPEPHEAGRPRRAINALILGGPASQPMAGPAATRYLPAWRCNPTDASSSDRSTSMATP